MTLGDRLSCGLEPDGDHVEVVPSGWPMATSRLGRSTTASATPIEACLTAVFADLPISRGIDTRPRWSDTLIMLR